MPRRISTLQATQKSSLDARAQAVLAAVIKEHLVTGEAVGSLVLSERIAKGSGWSSDVCSSDLSPRARVETTLLGGLEG